MKPFLFVLGTRPEAIKLLPLVWEFQKRELPYEILHTDQHAELLDDLLTRHQISPDYRLFLFGRTSGLCDLKAQMLTQMRQVLADRQFSAVLVQGDTLSALVGAEYGFFNALPVVHIEAGMRTYRQDDPSPEEALRRMIAPMARLHFCPSEDEARHLLGEGIPPAQIFTVGNSFADYWLTCPPSAITPKKQILITIHRRENLPFLDGIFARIKEITGEYSEYEFLFPVHPNPMIIERAEAMLKDVPNLHLRPPMPPDEFYGELLSSEMIVTDSGGVQEECIFHAKKVLILRKVSERRADFEFSMLVDPEDPTLKEKFHALLAKPTEETHCGYYGSGGTARKIVEILKNRALNEVDAP